MDLQRKLSRIARTAVEMLEGGECGFTKEQEEQAYRTLCYWVDRKEHFDELSARASIAQMYYYTSDTERVFGAFIDYDTAKKEYEKVKDEIPDYNVWDFSVTINMMYKNYTDSVRKWTSGKEKLVDRMTELSVCFLSDEKTDGKIWWYMNTR